jgi:hypothetical protein
MTTTDTRAIVVIIATPIYRLLASARNPIRRTITPDDRDQSATSASHRVLSAGGYRDRGRTGGWSWLNPRNGVCLGQQLHAFCRSFPPHLQMNVSVDRNEIGIRNRWKTLPALADRNLDLALEDSSLELIETTSSPKDAAT